MHFNASRLFGAALAVSAFVAAPAFSQNLVTNGSFEEPVIPANSFSLFDTIPGWTAYEDAFGPLFLGSFPAPIEIQHNDIAGTTPFGDQFIELDSTGNSLVFQFIPTQAGATYVLNFAYSKRPNVGDNSFGYGIGSVGPSDNVTFIPLFGAEGTTNWLSESKTFTGQGGEFIYFFNNNPSDSLGSYIDNVSVTEVPEPGVVATGIVLFGGTLFGVLRGRLRRK